MILAMLLQDKHNLINFILKSQKILSLNSENTMYQAIAIFQESSGFLKWESIFPNVEKYFVSLI